MAFLELTNVSKSFGRADARTHVLGDVNLTVERGEFVAIVGYSGAGKTTLINLMAGLVHADAGEVLLNGQAVTGPSPDRAVVFQNYSLLPWMSVLDNVFVAVEQVFPKWPMAKKLAHAERFVTMVNLAPAKHKKPSELSGGMRQRVSVARALAIDPQVLLLDEPLGALDALTRATLQDEIERIWRGESSSGEKAAERKTVVLITNDVDEGILLADRIIPLSAGPGATLGPSIAVDLDRPRDRTAINHCPRFKEIRSQVFGYLLGPGSKRGRAAAHAATRHAHKPSTIIPHLPDLKPLDLSAPRRFAFNLKRRPMISRSVARPTAETV
jgi:nitrate/nitrite transport system ATP-binding protein